MPNWPDYQQEIANLQKWASRALEELEKRNAAWGVQSALRATLERLATLASPEAQRGRPEAATSTVAPQYPPKRPESNAEAFYRPARHGATVNPGPGEIIGRDDVLDSKGCVVDVPPAAPLPHGDTDSDTDTMGYNVQPVTIHDMLNSIQCPHCDGTGICPGGFPLPVRCGLCAGDAIACCRDMDR